MSGHSHSHGHTAAGAERGRLRAVLAVTLGILAAELVGAALGHSLVLLADAAHLAADAAGMSLTLLAVVWATRPRGSRG